MDDTGVKVAARVLTWECDVSDDKLRIINTDNPLPTGFDVFPEPMRSVAYALPSTSSGFSIVTALASALATALSPNTAPPLNGIDFTFDVGNSEDPSDMFDVTMEIRNAKDMPQIVAAGGTVTLDYLKGTFQNLILAADVTSMTVINWPRTGKTGRLILKITNTGSYDISGWPVGTIWDAGGVPPTITVGAGKRDLVVLTTATAGTEVFANVIGQDYE